MGDEKNTAAAEPTQLRIDVKTIKPVPRATIVFKGKEYEVLSLIDLDYPVMVDILSAAQPPVKEGESQAVANVERARKQLQALVPGLDGVAMTYREMVSFLEAALGSGENPQPAGTTSS